MSWFPKPINSIKDLNISKNFIHEMILKILYAEGVKLGKEISNIIHISFNQIEDELLYLKSRELVIVTSSVGGTTGYHAMKFELSSKGRAMAKEFFNVRPYIGPLPVQMADYIESVKSQKVNNTSVTIDHVKSLFKKMILKKELLQKLGPAINSGGPLFLYGKPGNGKTMIAEEIIEAMKGELYIPHSILVDGQIIRFFDKKTHKKTGECKEDKRWIKIKRPLIVVGGELTLPMLDLIYKDEFKSYEAPFQLMANGGILLIDDFGRQLISPKDLLNRWIYPLEKKVDFLTLVTGKKVEVPFNQMLIFSTNLNPNDLADEAFWRRIKYKIEIESPSFDEFKIIFKDQCKKNELVFRDSVFDYLVINYYKKLKMEPRGVHARDLISHVVDFIHFYKLEKKISKKSIDFSWKCYFSI